MTPILEVKDLVKRFAWRGGRGLAGATTVTAVDGVSFRVPAGGILGIVGESGCGKSTLVRAALRLLEPDAGRIFLAGEDLMTLRGAALKRARRRAQMVFQDSAGALDPRMRCQALVAEPLLIHGLSSRPAVADDVRRLLDSVGLSASIAQRFPHQLSGGQRQRLAIARALATEPELLVLDEPVSSLDASVQARILELLSELRRSGTAMVVISHDLTVIDQLADEVAVMYCGRIVEHGPRDQVLGSPRHHYTVSLLAALPRLEIGSVPRALAAGEVPSLIAPPPGCSFHPRCSAQSRRCETSRPVLEAVASAHAVACHHPLEVGAADRTL